MKRLLIFIAVFLLLAALMWMFVGVPPAKIDVRVLGRTNHPAGPLRYLVAITNRESVRVQGVIAGEMIPGQVWTNTASPTGSRFHHFTFLPGEGGLFGCKSETNAPGKILITYSVDSGRTALVRKWRVLRKFQSKSPRDLVPNARTLTADAPR